MPLTDVAVRRAKPKDKAYKLFDERGMYLLVSPSGAKLWRLKYRHAGKEKTLALGQYSEVTLADARDKRDTARKQVHDGIDPSAARQREKRDQRIRAESTFEVVAREWHAKQAIRWSPAHADDVIRRLSTNLFPAIGARPIAEIDAPELLDALRVIERRGAHDIAHRLLQTSGQVFRYAIANGRAHRDPSRDLRGALTPGEKTRHHAALSEAELPEFLGKLRAYDGHAQTALAMRLLLLTFVRTGELRGAEWGEVDFERSTWRIPAERMKTGSEHLVPLSAQAIEVLRELQRNASGSGRYVFPNLANPRKGAMSENTMLYALYRMGYHSRATGHGFRATASTILNERGYPADVIERQLAHVERNRVRAAYHRSEYLLQRRAMMQDWADHLDALERADVTPTRAAA